MTFQVLHPNEVDPSITSKCGYAKYWNSILGLRLIKTLKKQAKIVLEPLKYIDFTYVYVDFTVEKFYWKEISRK